MTHVSRRSLFLPYPSGLSFEEYVATVRELDRSGWEGVWINEVIDHDPFSILAVCARETTRIQLGTSVATWTRTVPTMAAAAATVDAISHGRMRLGLGTMPRVWNEDWHGIDTSRLVRRMREYIEALRVAWASHSGRSGYYDGEIFRLKDFERATPPQRDRIPIYIGASGPQLTRLAGRLADGVLLHSCFTVETLTRVTRPALEAGAQAAGRSASAIDVSVAVACCISDDRDEAMHWAKAQVSWYATFPYNHWVFAHHGWEGPRQAILDAAGRGDRQAMIDAVSDEMALAICLVGTPAEVRAQARRYEAVADLPRYSTPTEASAAFKRANLRRIIETFAPLAGGQAA